MILESIEIRHYMLYAVISTCAYIILCLNSIYIVVVSKNHT